MLLDETIGWMYAGGETTCETDMKQWVKQIMKRAREKNESVPKPACHICGTW
jgi:hypothetical protein